MIRILIFLIEAQLNAFFDISITRRIDNLYFEKILNFSQIISILIK